MIIKKQIIPLMIRENRICDPAISHFKDKSGIFEKNMNCPQMIFTDFSMKEKLEIWKALTEGISEWQQTKEYLNFFIHNSESDKN